MSRKMYTAEGIAEILINLPNDNSVDTDVEEDWDETDADITIDICLLQLIQQLIPLKKWNLWKLKP